MPPSERPSNGEHTAILVQLATLRSDVKGLTDAHTSLDKYVRGEMAQKLDSAIRRAVVHGGELETLKKSACEWEEKQEKYDKALTILLERAEQGGARWDKIISFGITIIESLSIAGLLWAVQRLVSMGGP